MKRLGLIDAEKKLRKTKKTLDEERQKEETKKFIQELTALGVIKDNKIAALEMAPEYFRVVIEVLQMYGEISSSELLKSVKYKVTAGFALNSTAKTIQALAALGLVEVKTNKRTPGDYMEAVVIEGFEKKGYVLKFVREGANRFAVLLWFNDELKSARVL